MAGLMSGKVEPIDTPPGKESFHSFLSIEDDLIIKKLISYCEKWYPIALIDIYF